MYKVAMFKLIKGLLIFLLLVSSNAQAQTWWVSPNGNDLNSGTEDKPFKTIEKALLISRTSKAAKEIILMEGEYYNTHLELNAIDSKLTLKSAKNAFVKLYGGVKLTSLKKEGTYLYADIKGSYDRSWDFRMVEVNGEFRERARFPEKGAFTHLNVFDVKWLSSEAGGWERKPTMVEKMTLKYNPADIGSKLDVNNAELTIYHEWDETLVGLKLKDTINHTLTFDNESQHPPGAFAERNKNAQTYVVWNTIEGMKKPGNWYLDRTTERFYYWPKEGETAENITVVVPEIERIITLNNVSDVTIEGISFASTTTPLVTGGYGALKFEGAITGSNVKNITIENVKIKNVGGWGIKLSGSNIAINNSEIFNCGAGAISYSCEELSITNSSLHDIGLIYFSAVGIFGQGNKNTIKNNELWNMPYCGINGVGNNSLVDGNVIHNIKTFMQDGGAIYMFGHKNTVVKNNVVLSKSDANIKVNAYYLDEGCDGCVVENNLSYNAWYPVLAHMTRNCSYINNIFIDENVQNLAYANSSNLTFNNNILIAKSIVFKGPTKESPSLINEKLGKVMSGYSAANGITSWKNNIFYSKLGDVEQSQLAQYKFIKKITLTPTEGTLFQNPQLTGIESGNFLNTTNPLIKEKGIILHNFQNAGHKTDLKKLINNYFLKHN